MYASDLFLLSTTSNSVQSKLDILEKYFNDKCKLIQDKKLWFLTELEKLSENFSFQNKLIECVQQYK